MLFARWQHHLRFCSGFPYAPLKAMVTEISKWSRIQDSFRITPKIESLVGCAIPDIPSKFQKDPSITFWVILLTHRKTDKVWQKHYILGGGNNNNNNGSTFLFHYSDLMLLWSARHLLKPTMHKTSSQTDTLFLTFFLLLTPGNLYYQRFKK